MRLVRMDISVNLPTFSEFMALGQMVRDLLERKGRSSVMNRMGLWQHVSSVLALKCVELRSYSLLCSNPPGISASFIKVPRRGICRLLPR